MNAPECSAGWDAQVWLVQEDFMTFSRPMRALSAFTLLGVAALAGACGDDTSTSGSGAGGSGGGGITCQAPLVACGDQCVVTVSDPLHCGACDNACAAGAICLDSACVCGPGLDTCGDTCTDLETDADNCGACGESCLEGQLCEGGSCSDCPTGTFACVDQGVCANLATDTGNCGACGVDCAAGGSCSNGACVCAGALESCPSGCEDLQTDAQNCGACGAACLEGQVCSGGVCSDCPANAVACTFQGVCANLDSDQDNCGGCGISCGPGGTCTNGACQCATGNVNCGSIVGCVDLTSDEQHCGGCFDACPYDAICTGGNCECNDPGEIACGNDCTDPSLDPNHCGSCGNDCDNQYGVCTSGVCGCLGGLAACGNDNTCTDLAEDPNNCGSCGNVCGDAQLCSAGACVCRPGLTLVNGNCVDTQSNPQACSPNGQNPVVCSGNTPFCNDGLCASGCTGANEACGFACVDRDNDPLHCGGCNAQSVCNQDEVCVNGNCREWAPGLGCNTCPCPGSCQGDLDQCCLYPGAPNLVACVQGNDCPQ